MSGGSGEPGTAGPVGAGPARIEPGTAGPQPVDFDPYGPLPSGTVVLEASAGTGKTWTIATLATRFVAEGVADLSELMLATFGRAATQELRERTRERMTATARGLADPMAVDSDDELVARLAATDRAQRHRRLVRALSDFDGATIATTHSFCQRMLDGLGLAGEREPNAALVEEVDDLTREVADDLYLQRYAGHDAVVPRLTPQEARDVALEAVRDRQARLEPDAEENTEAGQRVAMATAARVEVERRKRRRGIRDFDDLLILLRDVLADPERGPAAANRIRERYRVVLVDEFQDTDPVQWEVLRRAFDGHSTLVLIGDPKQAVYAFRGAEVRSYLDAVQRAGAPQTLGRNWRSDARLLSGLDQLYGGAALGHEQIVVRPVEAARPETRLTGAPCFRLRQVMREGRLYYGFPTVGALRQRVADDLAEQMVQLLEGPARLDGRRLVPGDLAVLVRTWRQMTYVWQALDRAGLPWVLGSSTSVFETSSATAWLYVLQALEQPHRAPRVRLAALTPLLGRTATELAEAGDAAVSEVGLRLREWAGLFARSGFAAAFERLAVWSRLEERLLHRRGGERELTDLRHLAQVLDRVGVERGLGLTALTGWLAERIADPRLAGAADRSRRLDSDAAAVQVLTVHGSKGLEYPVVYVPFGWDGARNPDPGSLLLHDADGVRVRDIGGEHGSGYDARRSRHDEEEAGEELRLLYVALTRAQSQVVAWWAPSKSAAGAPLHRLLFGRTPGRAEPSARAPVPADAVATARLSEWAAAGGVVHEIVGTPSPRRWDSGTPSAAGLAAARFDRIPDSDWRRSSYSSLTAAAHESPGVGSEVEQPAKDDEPDDAVPTFAAGLGGPVSVTGPADGTAADGTAAGGLLAAHPAPGGLPSTMNGLPAGAAFGTLVHEVLERVDTAAGDLDLEVRRVCARAVGARLAGVDPEALAAALLPVLRTPLGLSSAGPAAALADTSAEARTSAAPPGASAEARTSAAPPGASAEARTSARDVALADIAPADQLAELAFELPLAGGDVVVGSPVTVRDIAALLRSELPADDVLADYPDRLATVESEALRGYLTGSIDLVLRRPGPRYVVLDHKTNRLGDGPLTTADYDRAAMAAEMARQHYPLQALLYSVALHRYLRWRQPGYDPATHLGGVRYLFLRGMVGPATPPGCGVFAWDPPASLVVALSDLLAGRA